MVLARDFIEGGKYSPIQDESDSGVGSSILWTLGLLDRPRNAIASGVKNLVDDNPDTGFFEGAKKGFMGDTHTSYGDLLGIGAPQESDDLASWLGKGGARFLLDAAGDPTNLVGLGVVGKVAKAIGVPTQRVAAAIGGTGVGKAFAHGAWGFPEVAPSLDRAMQTATRAKGEATDWLKGMAPELEKKGYQFRSQDIREALERPDKAAELGIPQDVLDLYSPKMRQSRELFDEQQALRDSLGMDKAKAIEEPGYEYLARFRKDKPLGADDASRTIRKLVNPETGESVMTKMTKADLSAKGIIKEEENFYQLGPTPHDKTLLEPRQASLRDIVESGFMKPEAFVSDPAATLALDISRKSRTNAFLKWLKENEGDILKPMDVRNFGDKTLEGLTRKESVGSLVDNGYRRLNIPGLEGYGAHKSIANYLENVAKVALDPSTPAGSVEHALRSFFDETMLGGLMKKGTTAWKQATLGLHPGYHAGNVGSNQILEAGSGMRPWKILGRDIQALKVQKEFGDDVIKGMTNSELKGEFEARNLFGQGMYGSEGADTLRKTLSDEPTGVWGAVVKAHQKGTEVGGAFENNAKAATAIDYIKREAPNFAKMSPEEQSRVLDDAVQHARKYLGEYAYSRATPLEKQISNVIPFYGWTRGMLGLTGQQLVEHPDRLARLGRGLDTVFTPLDAREQALADPQMREDAPTKGAFGMPWGDTDGHPSTLRIGRFLPQGNLEQLISRPLDFLTGSTNPAIKVPIEGVANKNSYLGRDIDRLSGNFLSALVNPIVSTPGEERPYEQGSRKLFGMNQPAAWQYLLGQVPGGRYLQEADLLARGTGAVQDPYQPEISMPYAAASYLTGSKLQPWDEGKLLQKRVRESDDKGRSIKAQLKRAASKGDAAGAQFYTNQLQQHLEGRAKAPWLGESGS